MAEINYSNSMAPPMPKLFELAESKQDNSKDIREMLDNGADWCFESWQYDKKGEQIEYDMFTLASAVNLECVKQFLEETNPVMAYFLKVKFDNLEFDIEHGTQLVLEAKNRIAIMYPKNSSNQENYDDYDEIEELPSGLDAFDIRGHTLLIDAIQWDLIELVKLLIEHGADINQEDMKGDTPLQYANDFGTPEVVKIIVS